MMKYFPRVKQAIEMRGEIPLVMSRQKMNTQEKHQLDYWLFRRLYPERFNPMRTLLALCLFAMPAFAQISSNTVVNTNALVYRMGRSATSNEMDSAITQTNKSLWVNPYEFASRIKLQSCSTNGSLVSTNGVLKLGNGVMAQWSSGTAVTANGTQFIAFAVPYTNFVSNPQVTHVVANPTVPPSTTWGVYAYNVTTNGCTVVIIGVGGSTWAGYPLTPVVWTIGR